MECYELGQQKLVAIHLTRLMIQYLGVYVHHDKSIGS